MKNKLTYSILALVAVLCSTLYILRNYDLQPGTVLAVAVFDIAAMVVLGYYIKSLIDDYFKQ